MDTNNLKYGTITFEGFGPEASQNAKFVILDAKMTGKAAKAWGIALEEWNLASPDLLISVTGGAKNIEINKRLLERFKKGLMKVATTTRAWILTGGTKGGVMEFVGNAAKEFMLEVDDYEQKLCVVGISLLGCVAHGRELLQAAQNSECYTYKYTNEPGTKGTFLDPHHTHFFLVDDGTSDFGGEINFRAEFEQYKSREEEKDAEPPIPVVMLMVEGGQNTVKTACEAIKCQTPVIVFEGTGRAADFIVKAHKLRKSTDRYEQLENDASNLIAGKKTEPKELIQSVYDSLLHPSNEHLIQIYKSTDEDEKNEVDDVVLRVLRKASAKDKSKKQRFIYLAFSWDLSDVIKNDILSFIKEENSESEILMTKAIQSNKFEFVQLFLDSNFNLSKYLTVKKLSKLYDELIKSDDFTCKIIKTIQSEIKLIKSDDFSCKIIKTIQSKIKDSFFTWGRCCAIGDSGNHGDRCSTKGDSSKHKLEEMEIIINDLSHNQFKGLFNEYNVESNSLEPSRDLFLLSLLMGRIQLSHIFWRLCPEPINAALTGSIILQELSAKALIRHEEFEYSKQLNQNAKDYETLAIGILNEAYDKNLEKAHHLLVKSSACWGGHTAFELAEAGGLMDFVAQDCCQTKLNKVWNGNIANYTPRWKLILSMFLPIFSLLLITFKDGDVVKDDSGNSLPDGNPDSMNYSDKKTSMCDIQNIDSNLNMKNKEKKKCNYRINKFIWFFTSPVVKFGYHTAWYIIFLMLFSYFLLVDLHPSRVSICEGIVWACAFTMFIDELQQVYSTNESSFCRKILSYLSNLWNLFDQLIYILFIVSIALRLSIPDNNFYVVHMVYTITFVLNILRILENFYIQQYMGPKVIMIGKMMLDLLIFIVLCFVFLLAYGIASQSLLYPNSYPSWAILYNILYNPYFTIHGNLNLDELSGKKDGCTDNSTVYEMDSENFPRCPQKSWLPMLLYSMYLIMINIMLINLLIAIFSYTFQNIQDIATKTWQFHRLGIIRDYVEKSPFVPPFLIFYQIYSLVIYLRCNKNQVKDESNPLKKKFEDDKRLCAFEMSAKRSYLLKAKVVERNNLDNKIINIETKLTSLSFEMELKMEQIFNKIDKMKKKRKKKSLAFLEAVLGESVSKEHNDAVVLKDSNLDN